MNLPFPWILFRCFQGPTGHPASSRSDSLRIFLGWPAEVTMFSDATDNETLKPGCRNRCGGFEQGWVRPTCPQKEEARTSGKKRQKVRYL